jgi:hypothetical protein
MTVMTVGSLLECGQGNPDYLLLLVECVGKLKLSSAITRIWGKSKVSSAVTTYILNFVCMCVLWSMLMM